MGRNENPFAEKGVESSVRVSSEVHEERLPIAVKGQTATILTLLK
jgi:hypothetical protein